MADRLTSSGTGASFGNEMLQHFNFAPGFRNLNNGSFGAVPRPVLAAQRKFQDQIESAPDPFLRFQQPELIRSARQAIADVVKAPLSTVVFVSNATTGINLVLRNLIYEPGDKILMSSVIYGACEKAVLSVCETTPAEALTVTLNYPMSDANVLESFEKVILAEHAAGMRIKIAIFDTISSMPAVRLPYRELIDLCKKHKILSCVDAAHGVGQLRLNLVDLDPDFLVSNLHKWMFTPRGCALFYVPLRNQGLVRTTLPTSHGFLPRTAHKAAMPFPQANHFESMYVSMFDFIGTLDMTPFLCVPAALHFRQRVCGGEEDIMRYCVELVAKGAVHVAKILDTNVMQNKEETLNRDCAMANVKLPVDAAENEVRHWIESRLADEYNGFIAIFRHGEYWWARLSGQIWLDIRDFEWAGGVLLELCSRVRNREHLQNAQGLL